MGLPRLMLASLLGLALVCAFLLGLGQLALPAAAAPLADIIVSSNITSNTTWTPADNTVIVSGTVGVQAQLTIQPGVVVSFTPGSQLVIQPSGQLLANGSAAQPIRFTSTPGTCTWEGIRLESDSNQIQYASFEYASQAIKIESSNSHLIRFNTFQQNGGCAPQPSPFSGAIVGFTDGSTFSGNVFTNNHTAIFLTRSGGNTIENNVISGATVHAIFFSPNLTTTSNSNAIISNTISYAGEFGLYLAKGIDNSVLSNTITNNGSGGVYIEDQTATFGNSLLVQNNDIYSNTGPAVEITDTATIDLSENLMWDNSAGILWGFSNNSVIAAYNLDSNVVCQNTQYLIRNADTAPPFSTPADLNWWGTNTPTTGAIGSGSDIEGSVTIDPRLIFTATSAITALPADGVSTTVVTISLNSGSTTVPARARTVNLSTNLGTLSAGQVTLNANGVATVTLTAANTPGTATLTATEFCNFAVATSVEFLATDVGVAKSTTVTQVIPGQTVTYTIAYSNSTAVAATNVVITDTLPTGLQFVSDDSAGQGFSRTVNGQNIVWTHPSLGGNVSGVITLIASLPQTATTTCGQTLTNSVVITTSTIDNNPANNSASAGGVAVICADVRIQKTTTLTQVVQGNTITYTLIYSNAGTAAAANVVITDTLPTGSSYVTDTSGLATVAGGGVITWQVGSLATGGSGGSFQLVLSTGGASCPGSLSNAANISTTTPESNTANNSATAGSITVTCADVTLTKVAPTNIVAGTTVTYTIFYTNIGATTASNVVITDIHPITGGVDTLVSGASLNPGQGASVSYPVFVNPAICGANPTITITNTATIATTSPETDVGNNVSSVTSAVQCIPNLVITKTLAAPAMSLGKPVTFTIAYQNIGVITAPNTVITDFLALNVSYITDTFSTAPVTTSNTVVWSLGNIAPGAGGSFEVALGFNPPSCVGSTSFLNQVSVASDLPDADSSNNSDLELSGSIPCDVDLVVLKNDGVGGPSERPFVLAGDLITYTITYLNAGGEPATGVVLTETLPAYTQFVGPTGANGWFQVGSTSLYTYNLGTLAGGTGNKLNFVVRVVPTLPATVTVVNNQIEMGGNETEAFPADNISFEQTPVQAAPDLLAQKAALTPVANPDGQVTYVITVTNQGTITSTNVFITDTLPVSTTYVTNTVIGAPVSVGATTVVWNVGQINPAQTVSFNLTLQIASGSAICASSFLTNTVTALGNVTEGNLTNNTASTNALNSPVVACRDVAITKTVDDPQTTLDRDVIYTLTYSNPGLITATNALITDVLPSGIIFVQSTPVHSGPFGGVYQWPVGDLSPGITGTIVITGHVANNPALCSQTLTNRAGITATIAGGDQFLGNNQATVDVTVLCVPDLVVVKNDGVSGPAEPPFAQAGDVFTYSILYSNIGIGPASGVVLTETLPNHTNFVGPVGANGWFQVGATRQYTYNLGTVNSGAGFLVPFVVQVENPLTLSGNFITNTVCIGGNSAEVTLNNNCSFEQTLAQSNQPRLNVAKSAIPASGTNVQSGQTITYTVVVLNDGQATANNVLITDTLPLAAVSFITATLSNGSPVNGPNPLTAGVSSLAVNQAVTMTVVVSVNNVISGTLITNTAQASADTLAAQQSNVVTHVVTTLPTLTPTLQILKVANPPGGSAVSPGATITYTIWITNDDLTVVTNATNVVITDTVPTYTTYISGTASASQGTITVNPNSLVVNVGTMSPGQVVSFTFRVSVTTPLTNGLQILNVANVSANLLGTVQSNPVTHTVVSAPALSITKFSAPVSGASVDPGDPIVYFILLTNNGSGPATNVTMTDTLPISTEFVLQQLVPPIGAVTGPNPLVVNIPSLAGGGGTVLFRFVVTVTNSAPNGLIIPNQAQLSSDLTPLTTTNVVTHIVGSTPTSATLAIGKGANPPAGSTIAAGSPVTYTITVTNTGSTTQTNVSVLEILDINTSLVFSSTTPAATVVGSNPLFITWPSLTAGQTATLVLRVNVAGGLPNGTVIVNSASAFSDQAPLVATGPVTHVIGSVVTPSLTITKTATPVSGSLVQFGDFITYTITVANTGGSAESNVVISDTLDANVTLVNSSTTTGTISGPNPLRVTIPTLNIGQAVTVTLGVTVTGNVSGTIINNRASVSSTQTTLPQVSGLVTHVISSSISALPNLTISKQANPPSGTAVSQGATITYTIFVTNSGSPATNVVITDNIPANTAFISGSATTSLGGINAGGSQITVTVATFPTGVTMTATFRVTVTTNLTTTISNIAQLSSNQTVLTNSNVVTHPVLGTASLNVYLPIIFKDFSGPSASLSWSNQSNDRVQEVDGSNPSAFTPDSRNDGAFLLAVNVGTGGPKTVQSIVLTSSQGGSPGWDTIINSVPVLGVFNGAVRLNNANGTISQTVNSQVTVTIYGSDDAGGTRFPPDTYDYTVLVSFTDGTSVTATARIPAAPPTPVPVCNVVANITVGNTPRGVALDATRNRAYVANFGSNSVSVINSSNNTVLQTLSPITAANGIAYDAANNIIWVTNNSSGQVTPIQADASATNFTVLTPVTVGSGPWGVAHDPVHNYVYVVNNSGNSVTVIDAATRSVVATLSGSFSQPFHVAANPVTGKVYATNFGNHTVTVINGAAVSSVVNLNVGDPSTQPYGVAVDEIRNLVYVSTVDSHRVVVIGTLAGVPDQLLGWAAFHRGFGNPARPVPLRAIAINPDIGPMSPIDDGGHVWMTTSTNDGSEANQALLSRKGWSGYFHSPVPCDVGANPSEGIAINRSLDRAFVTNGVTPGMLTVIVDNPDPPLVPFSLDDGIGVEVYRVE